MNFLTMSAYQAILPEILLLGLACILLLVDVSSGGSVRARAGYFLAQAALAGGFILTLLHTDAMTLPVSMFNGGFLLDRLAILTRLFVLATTFFAFIYAKPCLRDNSMPAAEYYALGLFATIGMLVMACAADFLVAWIGLELLSLSMVAMVALERHSERALEAAMKYFVMGGLASGLLLYGVSLIYGASGSIQFAAVGTFLQQASGTDFTMALAGMIFVAAGLLFKFGTVPFHMWVPDVYDGAPTCMTLFIACAPKIATFCITMRILGGALSADTLQWREVLIAVSVLSMFAGNLMAIAQTSMKRLFAYSSVAHMGYVLLGLIAGPLNAGGYSAAMFYMVTYVIVAAGAFAVIALLSQGGQRFYHLDDFRGLNTRHPWLAFLMMILVFSMAGVPPTVGFFAKLGLLQALVQCNMAWLAALALLFAIIGAYYYLRIVMLMYFEEPTAAQAEVKITLSGGSMLALSVNSIAALLLGLFPGALISLCQVSLF